MTETAVNSFVVRFTQEQNGTAPWHGTIRHVQSDTEIRFSQMEEAVGFMDNFVAPNTAVANDKQGSGR